MPNLNSPFGTIEVQINGEGPPLVCVHGSFSSNAAWRPLRPFLEHSVRLFAPNMWGCGNTDNWSGNEDLSVEAQAAAIEAVIDHVNEPVHLLGHSHGGIVALCTVLRRKELIKSMVLLDPLPANALLLTGDRETWEELRSFCDRYVDAFDKGDVSAGGLVLDYWTGPETFANLPERFKDYISSATPLNIQEWRANWAFKPDKSSLNDTNVPTLVVWGAEGNKIGSAIGQSLASTLGNAKYCELQGASHLMISTHSKEVSELISAHIIRYC